MAVPPRPAIRKPADRRGRSCCSCYRCCCAAALGAAVVAALVWWLFPDTDPPIRSSFALQTFTLTSSQLTLYGQVDLAVTNRNRYAFETMSTQLRAVYKDHTLLNATLDALTFPARQTSTTTVPIQLDLTQDRGAALIRDMFDDCRQGGGRIQLGVRGQIPVSTWFIPVWIKIPVDQAQSITCPFTTAPETLKP